MNTWLSFAPLWLMDMALLATALLAAALALRLILRDAKSRVLLAWGTWLGMVVAALVTLLPGWPRYDWSAIARSLNNEPANVAIGSDAEFSAIEIGPTLLPAAMQAGDDQIPVVVAPHYPHWRELAMFAWLTGGLAGLAWIALGRWQARKLLRHSQTAPRWIYTELAQIAAPRRPRVDVRTSVRLTSAVALRAGQPAILLPHTSADPANTKAVRAALAHEWAHVRHGDLWLLALERLLLPLLALHPLFWWLRRSTRLDQELLADAAAAGDKPVEYAEALVAWAKTSSPPPASLAALAFWDRPTNLTRRVHMILHQPRTAVTWFSRVLNVTAFACLLSLVGGLSVITLQPLAAEDEPAKSASYVEVERPIGPLPASAPATYSKEKIELSCIMLELEPAEMAKVLSGGEHPALPSPAVELGIQAAEEWSETLKKLEANPNVHVVSRPRLLTLNNRPASLEISGDTVQVEGRDEVLGLKVDLHPELLPKVGNEQQLLLSIAFERTVSGDSTGNAGKSAIPMKRKVQTKVAVPLGKVVVVADPSNRSPAGKSLRPVLLVIHPRLVAEFAETRIATPEEVEATSRREAAAVRRHSLLRLQRELAWLLNQTTAQPSVFVPAMQTQAQDSKLSTPDWPARIDNRSQPDRTVPATADLQLQQKLLELDRRESEINLQSALAEHERYAEMHSKNPGAISESEIRQSRLKVELAQIQVERMKVRLDAHRAANPPATPAAPRR